MNEILGLISLVLYFKTSAADLYYYLKDGERQYTTSLAEALRAKPQKLVVDFQQFYYVETVTVKESALPNISLHYIGDSGRSVHNCSFRSDLGYFKCDYFARIMIIEDEDSMVNHTIEGYASKQQNYVGCYKKVSLMRAREAAELSQCERVCETLFYGMVQDMDCFCIEEMSTFIPLNLEVCDETCTFEDFQICGSSSNIYQYVSVYSKATVIKGIQTPTWECIHENINCPVCPLGRKGIGCDIIDCHSNNGNCLEKKCQTFIHMDLLTIAVCMCQNGTYLDNDFKCEDIDECSSDPCAVDKTCVNMIGSYSCKCHQGFYEVDATRCRDIDECLCNPCSSHSSCVNSLGSFRCHCNPGFIETDANVCSDIDECIGSPCSANSVCVNAVGNYTCECNVGFHNTDKNTCKDIDECRSNPCSSNSLCVNSLGSFECQCNAGFIETEANVCSDIDECISNPCGENSFCQNLIGSYQCPCSRGFNMRRGACKDIDECENPVSCPNSIECVNLAGSYDCLCGEGMAFLDYLYWVECADLNECFLNGSCEEKSSVCLNLFASYACVCRKGYFPVDNFTCNPVVVLTTPAQGKSFEGPLFYYGVMSVFILCFAIGMTTLYFVYLNKKDKTTTVSTEEET